MGVSSSSRLALPNRTMIRGVGGSSAQGEVFDGVPRSTTKKSKALRDMRWLETPHERPRRGSRMATLYTTKDICRPPVLEASKRRRAESWSIASGSDESAGLCGLPTT